MENKELKALLEAVERSLSGELRSLFATYSGLKNYLHSNVYNGSALEEYLKNIDRSLESVLANPENKEWTENFVIDIEKKYFDGYVPKEDILRIIGEAAELAKYSAVCYEPGKEGKKWINHYFDLLSFKRRLSKEFLME